VRRENAGIFNYKTQPPTSSDKTFPFKKKSNKLPVIKFTDILPIITRFIENIADKTSSNKTNSI
jgi:hypothetical protein